MLLTALYPWNTHWETGTVSPLVRKRPRPRVVVTPWVQELRESPGKEWTVRIGARQIGKTTSLGHVAQRLLDDHGVAPERVVIAPMDQEPVRRACANDLHVLFDTLIDRNAPTRETPLYVLLDEIQSFPDWGRAVKTAWDRYHHLVRVIATGSSALRLLRPAGADFPGRIITRSVHPLKFREVVLFHPDLALHATAEEQKQLVALSYAARAALESPERNRVEAFTALVRFARSRETLEPFLSKLFLEYSSWGGYPACSPASGTSPGRRAEFFESALNAILAQDLYGRLSDPLGFIRLFRHICLHPGGKFAPYKLAKDLSVSGQTTKAWKAVLDDVLLVQQLAPLKLNLRFDKGRDKAYPTDVGWISFQEGLAAPGVPDDDSRLGLRVETVLVDHARRLQFNLRRTTRQPMGYVSDPEVDVAVRLGDRWLLLEAKFSTRVRRSRLAEVGGAEDIRVVVTRNLFRAEMGDELHHIPAHFWALVC